MSKDPENKKITFIVSNKPSWIKFDNRTGNLSGRPGNFDVGISKDIVISVSDEFDNISSLKPFYIRVVNKNDSPVISGTPNEFITVGELYSFRPKVIDPDIRISKDKLLFSIHNNPEWTVFNASTGELKGQPDTGDVDHVEGIIITVTDSQGGSDSLQPFDIVVALNDPKSTTDVYLSESSARQAEITDEQDKSDLSFYDTVNNESAVDPSIQNPIIVKEIIKGSLQPRTSIPNYVNTESTVTGSRVSDEDASEAISDADNQDLLDRQVEVKESRGVQANRPSIVTPVPTATQSNTAPKVSDQESSEATDIDKPNNIIGSLVNTIVNIFTQPSQDSVKNQNSQTNRESTNLDNKPNNDKVNSAANLSDSSPAGTVSSQVQSPSAAPKSPAFTNKIKTTSLQPTWDWRSGDEGNRRYRYIFGSELNFQSNQNWKEIETTTFTPDGKLTLGKYRLEIQEGHKSESEIWSVSSKSIIEIVANQKGSVSIVGQALEDNKLVAIPTDKDGIQSEVTYQWYRDNQLNNNATNSVYVITEEDVDKTIKVQISYIDNIDFSEKDIKSESYVVVNVNEERFLTKKADHLILEEDSETKNFPIFAEGTDNLDKNITYLNNNSEIANVVITDKNKLNITPIENQHGESIITVTSTSNVKEVKRFFYLVISNVNDQPKITSTPNLKTKEVELYKYQVKTTDDDSQLFSYSFSSKSAITKDMKIDANGLITWMPPNRKDSYLVEVEVVVNDNSGADNATDKQRFEIYVEAINDPPVLQW